MSKSYSTMAHNNTTFGDWQNYAIKLLSQAGINNARLDVLVLLEDALKQNRSHILANPKLEINDSLLDQLNRKLKARASRVPLAYIRGNKEFYGLEFDVTPSVLIPRPETEDIIDLFNRLSLPSAAVIADVGTGSGNIAVTLAKLHPELIIYAYDINSEALKVAEHNAKKHNTTVQFILSDLLAKSSDQFDVIIANLPYVDKVIPVEPELSHEPNIAIFAPNKGLKLIQQLIKQINNTKLNPGGWLILEAHKNQHAYIEQLCSAANLELIQTQNLIQLYQLSN